MTDCIDNLEQIERRRAEIRHQLETEFHGIYEEMLNAACHGWAVQENIVRKMKESDGCTAS